MPFMFYSKNLESLNELVFRHNIWGARRGKVQSSLENNPEHFKSGEKILWYHSNYITINGHDSFHVRPASAREWAPYEEWGLSLNFCVQYGTTVKLINQESPFE